MPDDARPSSEPEPPAEAALLFALVRERYGSRLAPAELEALRETVTRVVDGVRALRAVPLGNADGPILPAPPEVAPRAGGAPPGEAPGAAEPPPAP